MPRLLRPRLVTFPLFRVGRPALLFGASFVGTGLFGASCGVDTDPLFSGSASLAPLAGRAGNVPVFAPPVFGTGGGEGNVIGEGGLGTAQQRQNEPDAGAIPAGADAGPDAAVPCQLAADCVDDNACTFDDCVDGSCQHLPTSAGVACGSATENPCTLADSCDGAGHCLPNDLPAQTPCGRLDNSCAADTCNGAGACVALDLPAGAACGSSSGCGQPTCGARAVCERHDAANGSACAGGSCTVGACVAGQRVGCPQAVATAVPFQTNWSSVRLPNLVRGECANDATPDFAVEFVVPASGSYRIETTGSPDSVLVVARGACNTDNDAPNQLCDDDISDNNLGSRIDVMLTAGQTITAYVSAFDEGESGSGTLRISAL
jgi:hypothetical protein